MSYSGILTGEKLASRIVAEKFSGKEEQGSIRSLGLRGPHFTFEYTRPTGDSYFININLQKNSTHIITSLPRGRNAVTTSNANYRNTALLDDGSLMSLPFFKNEGEKIRTHPVGGIEPLLTVTNQGYVVANQHRLVLFNRNFDPVFETELSHTIDSLYADRDGIIAINQQDGYIDIHNYTYSSLRMKSIISTHSLDGRITQKGTNKTANSVVIATHNGKASQLFSYNRIKTMQIPLSFDLGEYSTHFDQNRDYISALSIDPHHQNFIGLSNGFILSKNPTSDYTVYASVGSKPSYISDINGWKSMASENGTLTWQTDKIDEPIKNKQPKPHRQKQSKKRANTVISVTPDDVTFVKKKKKTHHHKPRRHHQTKK